MSTRSTPIIPPRSTSASSAFYGRLSLAICLMGTRRVCISPLQYSEFLVSADYDDRWIRVVIAVHVSAPLFKYI